MEMEGSHLPNQALSRRMTTRESPKVCNRQHGDVSPRRTLVNSDMTLTRGTLRKVGCRSAAPVSQALPTPKPHHFPVKLRKPFPLPFLPGPAHSPALGIPSPAHSSAPPTPLSFSLGPAHFLATIVPSPAHPPVCPLSRKLHPLLRPTSEALPILLAHSLFYFSRASTALSPGSALLLSP